QAAAAGRYLQEVEPTAPAVIVVSSTAASEGKTLVVASRTIRSALPGAVVPRVYLAFGDPEAVAAGAVPTPGGTRFDTPLSGVLGLLWLVGLGWSVALTGGAGSIAALGLAPAFGMAALALVGLAGSLVSVALSGGQGAVLVASAAAVGWVPPAARRIAWRLRR